MDKQRIVIYERDQLTRELLKEWLAEAGYDVRTGTPHDARRDRPAELVVVSVYLPKCAGLECVRDIQAAHPGTPLIAISGHFRSGLAPAGAAATALNVQQVLAKPLVRSEVLRAVSAIMAHPA